MPFQGNGGKGVIDPNIFQMLVKEDQHAQTSQAKMIEMAMKIKAAQAKEARDAAAEERAAALHEVEMAGKQADLLGKQKGLLETTSQQGEAAGVNADSLPRLFAAQQAAGLSMNTAPQNVFTNNANPNFDFSMAPWDPSLIAKDTQEFEAAIPLADKYASDNPTGIPLMDKTYRDVGKPYGETGADVAQRAVLQGVVGENEEAKKVRAEQAKARFESKLSEGKEMRLKDYAAGIAANALGYEAVATVDRITSLSRAFDKEKDPEKKAVLGRKLDAVQAAWQSSLDQNLSGEAIKLRTGVISLSQAYRRKYQAAKYLETVMKNPDILGFAPSALQGLRNAAGVASEVTDLIMPSVRATLMDPTVPEDFKRRVDSIFFAGRDPDTGLRLEEGKLREAGLKWMLIMGVNESGRSTQKQIDEFGALTNAIGMTTSQAVALDRVRATYKTIVEDMNRVDRPQLIDVGIKFNDKGQILGDEKYWEGGGGGYPMIDEAYPGQWDAGQGQTYTPRLDPITGSKVRPAIPPAQVDPLVQRMLELKRGQGAAQQ